MKFKSTLLADLSLKLSWGHEDGCPNIEEEL